MNEKNEDVENFLASFPYADMTKRTYRDVLRRIFVECQNRDLVDLSPAELLAILHYSGWGDARQCVALAATQKFLAWRYGPDHPALAAKLRRAKNRPQRAIDKKTAIKLLASFDTYTPKGARDLAICALLLDTGLRASEICSLKESNTSLEQCVLQVIVKGGEYEAAIFSAPTAEYIKRWLAFRGPGKDFLFTHVKTGKGLTAEGLFTIVRGWGWRIGIELSPHDLRRSMAVIATLNGASERSLMAMGRWKNSAMIKLYTRTLKLEQVRGFLNIENMLVEVEET